MTSRRCLAALWLAAVAVAGCGSDDGTPMADDDPTPISGGVIVDTTTPTTVPIAGTAAELLPEMAVEMSRLGTAIGENADPGAVLARIRAMWLVIRPEVEATHPELVNGIGATVDMAETAVAGTQPADADEAFSMLSDLVDAYTGDG